jgi:hypothetical protein
LVLKKAGGVWNEFIWLRIGTSDWLLWTRKCTVGFRKMLEISWQPEQLLASQELFCSIVVN